MTYDYIIIGAGSAGCVLANRLIASGKHKVLLVEAGGPDKKQEIHIPAAFSKLFKTEVDWAYETEEQLNLHNRKLYWPRGKMLGGTSSINAMIYQRGHAHTYNQWAQDGNTGWSFDDVLPYFKKAQNQERGSSEYHGVDGPLNVADLRTTNPLSQAFIDSAQELGYEVRDDFNGGEQDGFGYYQVTQKNGQRHSTAKAYLKPILKRENLDVKTHTLVSKLLFEGKTCVGIVTANGDEFKASQEVILCGGAINSPQLLMLSGIGDGKHLSEQGIDIVHGLSGVGQNMQDHLALLMAYNCSQPITLAKAESIGSVVNYLLFKRGMLTTNVAEAGGFVKLNNSILSELQFHFGPVYYIDHGFTKPKGHGFSIGPTLVQPKSKGFIKLKSSNAEDAPIIQPNYLNDEADFQVLIEGMKIVEQMIQTKSFEPYYASAYIENSVLESEEDYKNYVSQYVESIYHPVGTCKMGIGVDAVVDPELKVHGVDKLRVVDASIMPSIPNANTNAPTIMIAEKAADIILQTSSSKVSRTERLIRRSEVFNGDSNDLLDMNWEKVKLDLP